MCEKCEALPPLPVRKGTKLEDLRGADFIGALVRAARRAFPSLDEDRAVEEYLKANPALRAPWLRAQADAAARGPTGKRLTGEEQLVRKLADGTIEGLRLAAEMEESLEGPGPDEVYGEIRAAAAGASVDAYLRQHPEEHARYRAAFGKSKEARVAYAEALFDAALEPVVKGLALDGLSAAEARAMAGQALPGIRSALRHAIARAKAGHRVAAIEAEHEALSERVRKLAIVVLERKRNTAGTTFRKCLDETIGGSVALRQSLRMGDEPDAA